MMEGSKLSVRTWLFALGVLTVMEGNCSEQRLAKAVRVSEKTAKTMLATLNTGNWHQDTISARDVIRSAVTENDVATGRRGYRF